MIRLTTEIPRGPGVPVLASLEIDGKGVRRYAINGPATRDEREAAWSSLDLQWYRGLGHP